MLHIFLKTDETPEFQEGPLALRREERSELEDPSYVQFNINNITNNVNTSVGSGSVSLWASQIRIRWIDNYLY